MYRLIALHKRISQVYDISICVGLSRRTQYVNKLCALAEALAYGSCVSSFSFKLAGKDKHRSKKRVETSTKILCIPTLPLINYR